MKISSIKDNISFDKVSLGNPGRIQGGTYYSKIFFDNYPFYLKIEQCNSKSGIIETGKKHYIDLLFTIQESEYIDLFNNIEKHLKKMLFEKATDWFSNKMDADDIDHFFNSCMRVYKTNKTLLRTYVNNRDSPHACVVFDENNINASYDYIQNKQFACILHIKGLRFTSNSFQLDIENKQILVLTNKNVFNTCLLHENTTLETDTEPVIETETKADTEPVIETEPEPVIETETDTEPVIETKPEPVIETKPDPEPVIETETDSKSNDLCEYDLNLDNLDNETVSLKDPKEVYYEMYKIARKKAKETRKQAIKAYMDAEEIRKNYMLDTTSDSDTDSDDIESIGNLEYSK